MRIFSCLRPPEEVLDHLDDALRAVSPAPLGNGPPPLRWVAPEHQHITLAFYGEIPDGAVTDLIAGVDGVAASFPAFDVQLTGAGVFTGSALWIGVRAVIEPGLMPRLMASAGAAGYDISRMEPRDRNRAHLTVARLSARGSARSRLRADLPSITHALSVYRGPVWRATEIEVVRSELGQGKGGGALHDTVARLPLRANDQEADTE